jgi:hypothetical protein
MGELRLGRVPDFDRVRVLADKIFQVDRQGAAVALEWVVAGGVHALGDVEDDGGEAIFVKVDFLVVGDFTNHAEGIVSQVRRRLKGESEEGARQVSSSRNRRAYLTSAKLSGRSHISAPPKRGVSLKRAIVVLRR